VYFSFPALEETIPWKFLQAALSDVTGVEKEAFGFFYDNQHLSNPEHKVTIDTFNQFVIWFGSEFISPKSCRDALVKIKHLTTLPWFHGLIEQSEANARLGQNPEEGTYLVRLSKTHKEHPFTLSMYAYGKAQHYRIKKMQAQDGKNYFTISGHTGHQTLIELVESLIDPLQLKHPCKNKDSCYAYLTGIQ